MTAQAIDPEPVPLVRDQSGRLMVLGTRISLDILVAAFKRGESPEAIHVDHETISLADVYAILAYYLRHRAEVEADLIAHEDGRTDLGRQIEEALDQIEKGQQLAGHFPDADALTRARGVLSGERTEAETIAELDALYPIR